MEIFRPSPVSWWWLAAITGVVSHELWNLNIQIYTQASSFCCPIKHLNGFRASQTTYCLSQRNIWKNSNYSCVYQRLIFEIFCVNRHSLRKVTSWKVSCTRRKISLSWCFISTLYCYCCWCCFLFADAYNYYFLLFFCTLSWSTYFLSFRNSRVHLLR